jgi:putative phosphoribosyl transferase
MKTEALFEDRREAGRLLARELARFEDDAPVVVALPRGGVPVAYEVARALSAPLELCVVRKIGAPGQPELGVGAVAEGPPGGADEVALDRELVASLGIAPGTLAALVAVRRAEARVLGERLRRGAPRLDVTGRTVIVVDDGIARGGTARAALRSLRRCGPKRLVLAVPVGSFETLDDIFGKDADEIVCPRTKAIFGSVGRWYRDFSPTTDEDVHRLLDRARSPGESSSASLARAAHPLR